MGEGSASIVVDRNGVEGACSGREVLLVGLLTRPRSDRSQSCERVTGLDDGLKLRRDINLVHSPTLPLYLPTE